MDRAQLFDTLSNLPPVAFEWLLIAVNMPRMNRAGAAATIGEQVSALLTWAESPIGPGVEAIAQQLTELNHFEFEAYLRSLVDVYEKWWEYYTLTDAVGKVEQPTPEKPSVFDFGLTVQTIAKETDGPGSDPRAEEREKIERLPVLEGIRKYADDHVLLVGRPGSGKSTALIRLLLEEANQVLQQGEGQVPVLVELRYWNTSIEGQIQGFLQRHGLTLDDSTLSTLLGQGRFLLLIDGLNELPSESARTQLTAFRRNHPKVPMIFTTRDLGLGGDLGIGKKLEMQPLTEPQMKDFIRAYVPDQAEAMLRQLNNRLREFGKTPLLLWMLCEVFQQSPNRQMPTNLAEVFRAFTTMYEDSGVRKHEVALLKGDVRPLSDRRLWKEALKALAALMMQGETPVDFRVAIHRTEAERELGKIFANEKFPVRDILDDLLKYHLLQNCTTDQLEFRHQLIQEYYAAEYLLRLLPELTNEQLKREYLNLLKWTEPIALMLALVDDEAQALLVVKLAMDDVDLMLGARLAGEVKAPLQSESISWLDGREIPMVLKVNCWATSRSEAAIGSLLKALDDQASGIRRRAAEALGQLGRAEVIPALLKALDDQEADVRETVVKALGRLGYAEAIPGLLKALDDQASDVCKSAAKALGQLGRVEVIPALLKALASQKADVRETAAEALRQLGRAEVIPALLKATEHQQSEVRSAAEALRQLGGAEEILGGLKVLEHHEEYQESEVRKTAVEALGQLGYPEAIPGLLKVLEHQESAVRRSAALALGLLGHAEAIPGLLKALDDQNSDVRRSAALALGQLGRAEAIPGLLKALDDQEPNICEKVATVLSKLGGSEAVPGLLKALENQDYSAFESATKAILQLGGVEAIPDLLKALEHQDYSAPRSAAEALGQLGHTEVIPDLLKALEHQGSDVRKSAAKALGQLGGAEAIPALLKALDDQNSDVRWSAAEALRQLGGAEAIPALLKALEHQNYFVRRSAVEALMKSGDVEAIPALLKALNSQNPNVRESAAWALGRLGYAEAIPALLNALNDQNSYVRGSATEALGQLGGAEAIPGLLKALDDQNSDVRESAALALGQLGGAEAIPGLLKALDNQDFECRWSAAFALGQLGGAEAIPGLLKTLDDQDFDVRATAAEALGQLGQAEAIPSLLKALDDENSDVRRSAVEALEQLGHSEVIPGLLKALNDQSSEIRWIAALTLGELGHSEAIPGLLKALNDQASEVRWIAALTLGELGYAEAIPGLLKVLDDQASEICWRVALELGKLGYAKVILGLLKALNDQASEVRRRVGLELGELGYAEAIPSLLKALNDQDCWSAALKLGELGYVEAIPGLLKALEHQDFMVRWSAAWKLEAIGSPLLLTNLWQLYRQQPESYLWEIVSAIQNRFKFYNHEIFKGNIFLGKTISLYFSYASADEALQNELTNHLTLLERQGVITSWSSHQILPGEERTQTIHQQLNTADIILLLISAHSLADDTCYHLEIQRAMKRHQSGEARVIPILLRPADWQGAPFSQLPLLPKNHQPVTTWPNQDEAFQEIATGIRETALELRCNTPTAG